MTILPLIANSIHPPCECDTQELIHSEIKMDDGKYSNLMCKSFQYVTEKIKSIDKKTKRETCASENLHNNVKVSMNVHI